MKRKSDILLKIVLFCGFCFWFFRIFDYLKLTVYKFGLQNSQNSKNDLLLVLSG